MSRAPTSAAAALILHIEDPALADGKIDRWLAQAGYALNPVAPSAASTWLTRHKPDLIILGAASPALDAQATCQQIKSDARTANIPMLQLTATDAADNPPTLLGADAYLAHPVQDSSLLSMVQLLLKARRVENAHHRATRKWERTFDAMSDAVLVLDAEQRVVDCNRAMDALFERDERDSAGRPLAQLLWTKIRELLDTAHVAGSPDARWEAEVSTLGRYYRVVAEESREQDEYALTVVTVGDITDRKALEQGYRDTATELTHAARRKDEFLAMLAHELRNPLNAIVAANQLQETQGAQGTEGARLRSVVGRQTRHLSRMIDDLLDVSRITRGDIALHFEPVDLRDVIARASESQQMLLRRRDQPVNLQLPLSAVMVDGDELRLEQVISNLLANASKYSEPGAAITLRLEVSDDAGHPAAVLTLEDNGVGIPADMLDAVFEMFVQIDPPIDRTAGGLGLGLTVVKHVIERHGGRAQAHSEGLGKGSQFVITLPLLAADDARPPSQPPAIPAREAMPLDVLLIEDNDDTRELMCTLLESRGHRVATASDGAAGVQLAAAHAPQVALVDIGLPGMNGYAVARELRASPDGAASAFLVALTGYGSPEDHQRASEAGFDAHMVKPIDTTRLFELLQRVAEQRRLRA